MENKKYTAGGGGEEMSVLDQYDTMLLLSLMRRLFIIYLCTLLLFGRKFRDDC